MMMRFLLHDDDGDEPVCVCGLRQILVVHGIGQAMKRVELGVTQLKGIVECCDVMRSNTEEINRPEDSSGPTDTCASTTDDDDDDVRGVAGDDDDES